MLLLGAPLAQPVDALAGSEYLASRHELVAGRPTIDLDLEARVHGLVLDANERGLLGAAHDCADGGLAVALAECCLAGAVGLEASEADPGPRLDAALFGEAQSRFIVAVPDAEARAALEALAAEAGVPVAALGVATGAGEDARLRLGPVDASLSALREAYEGGLPAALGAGA